MKTATQVHRISPSPRAADDGFTLIELLVVIAIIGILASMLLPVLASSKRKSQGVVCLNNSRQFALSWRLYAEDFDGWLPANVGGTSSGKDAANRSWAAGWMVKGSTTPDNTNTDYLIGQAYEQFGNIGYTYVRDAKLYKCPSDTTKDVGTGGARVRTISMNSQVGNNQPIKRMSDIENARSKNGVVVFIEERDDSLNDGWFVINMAGDSPDTPASYVITDFPAIYHNGATQFGWSDGRAEAHKWGDVRTMPPPSGGLALGVASPGNMDCRWLMDHAK